MNRGTQSLWPNIFTMYTCAEIATAGDSTKRGLLTVDWTVECGLDSGLKNGLTI